MFFFALGVQVHPLHPLATPMLVFCISVTESSKTNIETNREMTAIYWA